MERKDKEFANFNGLQDQGWDMTGEWWSEDGTSYVEFQKFKQDVCVGSISSHADYLARKDSEFKNFKGLADAGWELTGHWWHESDGAYVQYKKWQHKDVPVGPIRSHKDYLRRKDSEFANFGGLGDAGWELTGHWDSRNGTSFVGYRK